MCVLTVVGGNTTDGPTEKQNDTTAFAYLDAMRNKAKRAGESAIFMGFFILLFTTRVV